MFLTADIIFQNTINALVNPNQHRQKLNNCKYVSLCESLTISIICNNLQASLLLLLLGLVI